MIKALFWRPVHPKYTHGENQDEQVVRFHAWSLRQPLFQRLSLLPFRDLANSAGVKREIGEAIGLRAHRIRGVDKHINLDARRKTWSGESHYTQYMKFVRDENHGPVDCRRPSKVQFLSLYRVLGPCTE